MSEIIVTIGKDGNAEILVKNTLEDLFHDFQYFLGQARACSADTPETMFFHKRSLRAALFTLLGYVEGVTNRWLFVALDNRKLGFMFKRLQRDRLDQKIELICELGSTEKSEPDLRSANEVRNTLVHFKPGHDSDAFDNLSLTLLEEAAAKVEQWMTAMEYCLGLPRHHDSDELTRDFAANLGAVTREVSSKPSR